MALSVEQAVLTVDPAARRIDLEHVCADDVHQFIGGRGVAAKPLYERVTPQTDPLGPSNPLIFSPGVPTGTMAPAAARTTIVSKSPATDRYRKCSAGGHWRAELRYAGYDHVLITGASDRPVYLWMGGDQVELRDAAHLWGKGTGEADAVLEASTLCDDLGLDVLSTGLTIAWAMECYDKRLISLAQADGLELEWENAEVLLELIGRIARREGFLGDLLAEGTQRASTEVGGDSWKWAMQARGLEQSSPDARSGKGYALGFAINPRGPDHLAAQPIAEFGGTPEARAVVKEVCGDERYAVPHSSDKKAELVRWHEDCQAVSDALGVCMQVTVGPYMMTPDRMAALLSATWGIEIDSEELMRAGRRIVTLERCFNVRQGAERSKEQHLPWRRMHEPLKEGPNAGRVTSPAEMDRMLDEYYSLHGWDVETGCPTNDVLAALGLESLCSDLKDWGIGGKTSCRR